VLGSGPVDMPGRQRTLRGAIDWSYELLDSAERQLFARLAAFAGGWTLEAAEAVCLPADSGIDSLDGLASLADKSLIRAVPAAGASRFDMLHVIREFAAEKLDHEPDAGDVRQRHALVMLALAEQAEPELRRASLRRWQGRLRVEEENLRTALRWAVDGGDVEVGLRTAGAIWDFWHYWAELREGIGWLDALLAQPAAAAPSAARAKALTGLAGLLYWQRSIDPAWTLYEEALAIYRELGDERQIAQALSNSSFAALGRSDFAVGDARIREALDLYRRAGDTVEAGLIEAGLVFAPVLLGRGGDSTAAISAASQDVETLRALGRAHGAADGLGALAFIYRMVGDHPRGIQAARDALAMWHELGNMGRLPLNFKLLAALELAAGRPERAARLGTVAERYIEEIGGDLYELFPLLGDPAREAQPLLSPTDYARAVEDARRMSLEAQVSYALDETTAS
jgi:tetratricopeptide (TPR) repeat protein